ncbi:hypothetical protein J3A83DRAFT_1723597 [Scleroderma citrinum]
MQGLKMNTLSFDLKCTLLLQLTSSMFFQSTYSHLLSVCAISILFTLISFLNTIFLCVMCLFTTCCAYLLLVMLICYLA